MPTEKLKIADFRRAVESLDWNRRDLAGSTREEYVRADVETRLGRHIAKVSSLIPLVPTRFADDVQEARSSIARAQDKIADWKACREAARATQQIDPEVVRTAGQEEGEHPAQRVPAERPS